MSNVGSGLQAIIQGDFLSGVLYSTVGHQKLSGVLFEEQVLIRRPYLQREWCERTIRNPASRVVQPDGRIRHWCYIEELGKYLRVVTLEDGETILNAFPDRNFKEPQP